MDKNLKILIAEDHQLFSNGLKLILKEQLNIDVLDFATNGKEAIEKCQKQNFDVVLMDINMPIIDGVEATKTIKSFKNDTKILIVSMLSDFETVNKILKAGADGFLIKNADATEFQKAFHSIEKNEFYLCHNLSEMFLKDKTGKLISKEGYIQFTENLVSPREQSILKLIAEGFTNKAISETLSISVKTVDTHRNNMLAKLNLPNTAALVKFAVENKLV